MDEKIQKLKANINKEVVSKFDLAKLKEFQFLPINVKNTTLFAVGNQHTRKHEAGELIKAVCGCDTQFIFLPNEAFDELFVSINPPTMDKPAQGIQATEETPTELNTHSGQENKTVPKTFAEMNKMVGDILYNKGEITEVQLAEAMEDAKKRMEPIGTILYQMGAIALPRLKTVLAEVFNMENVTTEMFKALDKNISMLPEDFIRENKILPMFSDGKILQIGVVEPYNTASLKEIVYITGQNPKPYIITSYEFEQTVDKYFSKEKKQSDSILKKLEAEASQLSV